MKTLNTIARYVLVSGLLVTVNPVSAAYVNEVEPNDTLSTAQSLAGYFSLDNDPDIYLSTSIPHASVLGTGDGTYDWYTFYLPSTMAVTIDIDYGMFDLDTYIRLYNSAGSLITENDDYFCGEQGYTGCDSGSFHHWDSYINNYVLTPANYYIEVSQYFHNPVPYPDPYYSNYTLIDYTLHVSTGILDDYPMPEPATIALMGLGFAGMSYMRRKTVQA